MNAAHRSKHSATTTTEGGSKSVIVIGAGWSGLYALKTFLDEHGLLEARLFEMTDSVGGVWVYNEKIPGGTFRDTRTTASKCYLHASDFPMPKEFPHFPHHTQVLDWLKSYAKEFDLDRHIHYNTKVIKVRKMKDGRWKVVTGPCFLDENGKEKPITREDKQIHICDLVACASGQHQVPQTPVNQEPFSNFTGETMHSHYYKYPTKTMKGKTVLIVGGGESASDVAAEVSEKAKKTLMSIRSGVWFHDRTVGANMPADMVFTKHQRLLGFSDYQSWLIWIGRYMMIELMWGKGGTGIKEWQPTCPYFQGFVNKSRDIVDKVALEKVFARSGVKKIEGKKIWFNDSKPPEEVDLIIFATGYQANVPFLQPEQTYKKAYKLVFDPYDPTLCYIGSARPMIGSIPALAELQARWVAKVWTGKAQIPDTAPRLRIMDADRVRHRSIFVADTEHLPQLVNHWEYSDEIASYFGAKPNLVRWFFRNPFSWWTIISAPWNAFIYRVEEGGETTKKALKNINEHAWQKDHYPFVAFNYTMLVIDIILGLVLFLFVFFFVRFCYRLVA